MNRGRNCIEEIDKKRLLMDGISVDQTCALMVTAWAAEGIAGSWARSEAKPSARVLRLSQQVQAELSRYVDLPWI
jgi:hypothetical protein